MNTTRIDIDGQKITLRAAESSKARGVHGPIELKHFDVLLGGVPVGSVYQQSDLGWDDFTSRTAALEDWARHYEKELARAPKAPAVRTITVTLTMLASDVAECWESDEDLAASVRARCGAFYTNGGDEVTADVTSVVVTTSTATATFDVMTEDDRWEGFGYLGARENFISPNLDGEERAEMSLEARIVHLAWVDERIVRAAKVLGWDDEALFAWANSKNGRWMADTMLDSFADEKTFYMAVTSWRLLTLPE